MTAVAPPLPTAPLPPEHARAARRAGAIGGALVGVGLPLAASPLIAWAFTAFWLWSLSLTGPGIDEPLPEDVAYFRQMGDLMASPIAIAIGFLCVLVGGGLVALGIVAGMRRLRRAGVHRPVGVLLLGLLLARLGSWVVAAVSGLPEMLGVAWVPALMLTPTVDGLDGPGAALEMLPVTIVATAAMVVVGAVAAAGVWLGIGLLTTWGMAAALRARVPLTWQQAPWQPAAWQPGALQSTSGGPQPAP
ncbi:hypothetical protein GCM10009846_26840 [Agrococcus versicolor]|uniref:Uncharacterized protein n=1 Tax=Agrococcus versicolor TaxID=501482 RepID=A0ABN3AX47_9MICO